ncbi:MAG: BBP7 family outer membrane beta-barrel protein [Parachlamydiaceae bacterium]
MLNKFAKAILITVCTGFSLNLQLQANQSCYAPGCERKCPPVACDPCKCTDRVWVDAEYLYWQIKNSPEPVPLVIQSATNDPTLGSAGSTVVLGGNSINNDWRSGGKISCGYWFDDARCFGVDASYFFLPSTSTRQSVSSSGLPGTSFLAIPFFNVTSAAESSFVIANPDPLLHNGAYSALAELKTRNQVQGAELNGLMTFPCGCGLNMAVLAGFRYWNFNESLNFTVNSPYLAYPEDVFTTIDKFDVQNNFYGGQLGVAFDYMYDCFFVNLKAKVALGANCGRVDINGSLLTNEFNPVFSTGAPQSYIGGFFADPTNIGNHSKTLFSVIPEVNINIGYQIMDSLRLQVGYTFMYASNVLWAGKEIDSNLNTTQIPAIAFEPSPTLVGAPSPTPLTRTDGFWAQGVNVGLEFSF